MEAHDSQSSRSASADGNCSLDTVTLARQEREKQGTWEAEVSYGGEADLHRHLEACDKNPGHQNFIPVDQFHVEHLPSGYHDNDVVDWVRAMSDLTVRVSVTCVSENRPETVPGSERPYPCFSNRGRNMMRVGTGWIKEVRKFPNEYVSDETCACKECLISPTPKTQFAGILIRTAAHVVYDQLEAAHTTCHLFFDRGGTPDLCSGVVTLSGMSEVWSDRELDYSVMHYYTHDLDLADKLDKMVGYMECIDKKIYSKYKNQTSESDLTLTIIVAHPHGCSKQVSVGHYTRIQGRTCPGTGGAHLLFIQHMPLSNLIYSACVIQVLTAIAIILCATTAVLTIIYLVDAHHIPQEAIHNTHVLPEICMECVKLNQNCDKSTQAGPLCEELEKRWQDGVLKCCMSSQQVIAMLEMVSREREVRARKTSAGKTSFTFTSVSAHKQLHAPVGGHNLTEPVFNEGHNVALLLSNKDDPLVEHARGLNVTKDSLVIQSAGLYYIYTSVHYKPVSDRPAGQFKYQSWFHYVHRNSASNPGNSGTLLQTAHSVCHNCTGNEETAFSGGNCYLEMGDEIQVCFSSLGLVQFNKESTFVGLIKLDSGSSEEQSHG